MQLEHHYCGVRMLGWPLYLKNRRIEKYPAAKIQEEKNLDVILFIFTKEVFATSPRYPVREKSWLKKKLQMKMKQAEKLSLDYVLILSSCNS